MNRDALKAFFQFGVWITVLSVLLLFIVRPGTAEYVVTLLTLGIGLLLMVLVALTARFFQ